MKKIISQSIHCLGDPKASLYLLFSAAWTLFLPELNDFLAILDKRADEIRQKVKHHAAERKRRQHGPDAASYPPENSPKWTVSKDWKKGV
jgi:hypothetical protein